MTPESLAEQYEPRILALLERLVSPFPYRLAAAREDWADEPVWSIDAPGMCYLSFEILLDPEGDGAGFSLMAIGEGGRIIGSVTPKNYTDHLYIPWGDAPRFEERFAEFESIPNTLVYERILDMAEVA